MNMTVEDQKRIAKDIMDKVKIIDPYAILAGGAPRDWYFGNLCNDLDIYYYSTGQTISVAKGQLECLFPDHSITNLSERYENSVVQDEHMSMYNSMKFIRRVFETTVDGVRVQFIQLSEDRRQFDVVNAMDVSICQCWYNHYKDEIILSRNFKLTLASKIMFLPNGNNWADKHPFKMRERFPQFSAGEEDAAVRRAINESLRRIY